MSILILGLKRMLPPNESQLVYRWDRQTDGCQTVTLRFPLDMASITMLPGRTELNTTKHKEPASHEGPSITKQQVLSTTLRCYNV